MNLFSLNLSNNRLVSLPVELGKLSSLQYLVSWILSHLIPDLCVSNIVQYLLQAATVQACVSKNSPGQTP